MHCVYKVQDRFYESVIKMKIIHFRWCEYTLLSVHTINILCLLYEWDVYKNMDEASIQILYLRNYMEQRNHAFKNKNFVHIMSSAAICSELKFVCGRSKSIWSYICKLICTARNVEIQDLYWSGLRKPSSCKSFPSSFQI